MASRSPRRKILMRLICRHLGLKLIVKPQKINEDIPHNIRRISSVVMNLAKLKAMKASQTYKGLVIGADTVVSMNNKIFVKPSSKEEAFMILKQLSNKEHKVYTGVAIYSESKCMSLFYEVTRVRFRKLEERDITSYIDSGSPMDKAGAYGIQDDFGATFVEKITGDYFNVVGLPVSRTYSELKKLLDL
ncbi:MAG: Maf family protein [Ignavibacteria bacterium]|nr:Maf family protein [Ignavibacteria bacterium]